MTGNITVLDTKAKTKADVVKMAREIIARAEAGEIIDLTYAASMVDGSITTGFTATEDAHRRIASVSRLLHHLHRSMDE